jgi:O-antigen/teichoic acid export membrane protein
MNLKQKLLKGSFWNGISQFGSQGISIVLTIILARLLAPSDFGLLGMVTIFTGFLGYFSEFGFISGIIRKKNLDTIDLNTGFWSCIVFAIVIYILVFLLSPAISLFYHEPRLTLIARVVFLSFPIKALGFMCLAQEWRALRYDRVTMARLIAMLISGGMAVGFAFAGFGVWCLIIQNIALDICEAIMLISFVRWLPRFEFSFERFRSIAGFGMHITLNNLMKYASENVDSLLVGRLMGSYQLGVYTISCRMARYALQKIWSIFGTMLFPAFSSMQDDIPRLRKNLVEISLAGGFLLMPAIFYSFFCTNELVRVVLGGKWINAVPIIRLFLIYIMFAAFSLGDEPLMLAINKVKQVNFTRMLSTIALGSIGYLGIKKFGINGMAGVFSLVTVGYILTIKLQMIPFLSLKAIAYAKVYLQISVLSGELLLVLGGCWLILGNKNHDVVFLGLEALLATAILFHWNLQYNIIDVKKRTFSFKRLYGSAIDL